MTDTNNPTATAPEGIDQRDSRRVPVSMRAYVSDRRNTVGADCLICDASKSGCRIMSGDIDNLPNDILVLVAPLSKAVNGTIMWRRDGVAGVKFQWEASKMGANRGARRHEIEIPAVISSPGTGRRISCIVKNASGSGCLLVCAEAASLPDIVSIELDHSSDPLMGKIIWRKLDSAGLEFIQQTVEHIAAQHVIDDTKVEIDDGDDALQLERSRIVRQAS